MPTENMIAIPFGGQAYSILPVAPVPTPAPPPAPSQPAIPPPSTPASPSKPFNGNIVTTQSASIQQQKNPFLIGMTNTATTSSSGQYYGPPAPSGTTSTTKAIQRTPSNPTPGEAGAILVTIGFFGLGVLLAGATPFAMVATGPGGLVVGAAAAGAFYGGADAVEYDWVEGGNATPQGAFDAGITGITELVQGAMEIFGL